MKPTKPTPPPADDAHALDRHHAAHGHTDHDGLYNEDVAHEYSDVNVRSLLVFCLGLVVICGVVALAMWGLFEVFEKQAAKNDPVMSPLAYPAGRERPEPKLLENEPEYLQTIKTAEQQVLDGYGWMNQSAGVARIPIEEAKKRLLQHGLPVRQGVPVEPWMGRYSAAGGEASGGRMIPLRPGMMTPAPPAEEKPQEKPAAPKSGGH